MNKTTETGFGTCSAKWVFLEIAENSEERTFVGVSFWYSCKVPLRNFIEKEILVQMIFSREVTHIQIW